MCVSRIRSGVLALLLGTSLAAQQSPPATATLAEQVRYLLGQSSNGFLELRSDSIGAGMWRTRYLIAGNLDSATALTATSITELSRQHVDGRPGKAVVGVFPLGLVPPGDTTGYVRYRDMIKAALTGWNQRSLGAGEWTECADPRRGREVILSSGRTAGGQMLLVMSLTAQPDLACS